MEVATQSRPSSPGRRKFDLRYEGDGRGPKPIRPDEAHPFKGDYPGLDSYGSPLLRWARQAGAALVCGWLFAASTAYGFGPTMILTSSENGRSVVNTVPRAFNSAFDSASAARLASFELRTPRSTLTPLALPPAAIDAGEFSNIFSASSSPNTSASPGKIGVGIGTSQPAMARAMWICDASAKLSMSSLGYMIRARAFGPGLSVSPTATKFSSRGLIWSRNRCNCSAASAARAFAYAVCNSSDDVRQSEWSSRTCDDQNCAHENATVADAAIAVIKPATMSPYQDTPYHQLAAFNNSGLTGDRTASLIVALSVLAAVPLSLLAIAIFFLRKRR